MVRKEKNENNSEILPKITAELVNPLTLISPIKYAQYIANKPIRIEAILIDKYRCHGVNSISRIIR